MTAAVRHSRWPDDDDNDTRPDSLETKAPYKFFTYLLTYDVPNGGITTRNCGRTFFFIVIHIPICFPFISLIHSQKGRTGPPSSIAFTRWARWSAGQVGRHVKC